MKRKLSIWTCCFIAILLLIGCNPDENAAEEDSQQLSLIEIYSSDGKLINSIEDADILNQFSHLEYTDFSANTDPEQTESENVTEELSALYTIMSYKTPAAVFSDETLEKLTETTVYENSNIIKEQVEPENVKVMSIPEEYLTFYFTVSEEEKTFLLSLAESGN